MNDFWILLLIPIIWYFIAIGYQLIKLIKLWVNFKLQNIKEYSLWD
jgi:hypothetical protein